MKIIKTILTFVMMLLLATISVSAHYSFGYHGGANPVYGTLPDGSGYYARYNSGHGNYHNSFYVPQPVYHYQNLGNSYRYNHWNHNYGYRGYHRYHTYAYHRPLLYPGIYRVWR